MLYKTITLALIQDRPELYERLRSTKRLLPALDAYAIDLKASHEAWKARLARTNPDGDPARITSEALELAIEEIQVRLRSALPEDEEEASSLDAAMTYLRDRSRPA